mmetsp:Transcript_32875/g.74325  ORF Transcript_32875/g.74325 Transcript_32875/m.74325 type:complete len:322 (+) Transcript_32875:37-1002(+)
MKILAASAHALCVAAAAGLIGGGSAAVAPSLASRGTSGSFISDGAATSADLAVDSIAPIARLTRLRPVTASDDQTLVPPRKVQQEVEQMAMRAERLGKAGEEVAGELSIVEASLEKVASASGDRELAQEIQAVRAGLCAEQGFRSHERKACEDFMQGACQRKDAAAARLKRRRLISKVLCQRFFAEEAALKASAPAPAPKSSEETLPEPEAPASTGEPASPEFSKKERPLPSQGYKGDLVEHNDNSTATGDWQKEFGPAAGHRDIRAICRDFPDNQWCRLHMYHGSATWSSERSAAAPPTGLCAAFCIGLAFLACGVEGGR